MSPHMAAGIAAEMLAAAFLILALVLVAVICVPVTEDGPVQVTRVVNPRARWLWRPAPHYRVRAALQLVPHPAYAAAAPLTPPAHPAMAGHR